MDMHSIKYISCYVVLIYIGMVLCVTNHFIRC